MGRKLVLSVALVILLLPAGTAGAQPGLTRSGAILQYNGEPVTLVAYGCYGILTEGSFDYGSYFDQLQSYGINFVRVWGNYHWTNDLIPFNGTRNDANLTQLEQAYYDRLQGLVSAALARDIVVMFTFWDSCCLEGAADSGNRWINCPYRDANNEQAYCDSPQHFDDVPPDTNPPIWTDSHAPYMAKVVETIGAYPNVIYEIMNEPYPGFGDQAFHDHAIDHLHGLLNDPGVPGSRIIATNDGDLNNVGNPKVDVVARHVGPNSGDDFGGLEKPIIISNDGDDSQSSQSMGNAAERAQRVGLYAQKALANGQPAGHVHLEILDKDIYGSTWLSQDYDPQISNITTGLLQVLDPYADGLPAYDCPDFDFIIDDQDGGPEFTFTGDDWATWGTNGCGFDGGDSSYHYLSMTVGGDDKKGKAFWKPDLPVAGTYEITTWWRKTANRSTDADHYIHDGNGGVTHIVIDQKGDAQPEDSPIPYDCFSGWYPLGEFFCTAGVGGCYVELDGTDDNQSDEANAVRFTLKECNGGPVDPPPDPVETCDFPGEGPHAVKVYAEKLTANGWDDQAKAEGEPDGQEAHSPNVESGEYLVADFPDLCDPDGEETIEAVTVGVKLRTQYESGPYDIVLKFHGGGAAVLTTHHTQLQWDHLDITADLATWTWADVADVQATLVLDHHPGGNIDSDVWVDAFSLEVAYTTAAPDPVEPGDDIGPGPDTVDEPDTVDPIPGVDTIQGEDTVAPDPDAPDPDAKTPGLDASGPCQPDARRCNGVVVEVCALDGTYWAHYQTCGVEETCEGGACVPAGEPEPFDYLGNKESGCGVGGVGWGWGFLLVVAMFLRRRKYTFEE